MGKWRHLGAVALVCSACNSAGAAASAPAATTRPAVSAAPATLATTTTSAPGHERPPRVWNGDGTAAPALHNAGTDHRAIFLSLERYRVWLERHHPDPALVPRVWVDGTEIARRFRTNFVAQRAQHIRRVDVGDRTDATVVSVVDGSVTLLVDEHTPRVDFVDDRGNVVQSRPQGPVLHFVVLLDRGRDGRWRIASVDERVGAGTEVHL